MAAIPGNQARTPDSEAAFREKEWNPMATSTRNKGTAAALAQQLISGTKKHLAKVTQIPLAGSTYTPEQITNQLQQIVDLRADVDTAKATTKAKVTAEQSSLPSLRSFMKTYKTYLKAAYASTPDVLADFGLHAKEPTPLTAEAKTAAAAKRKATRAARHTMGSQQKKSVKGTVTGVVVTPIAPPPSVAATANGVTAPVAGSPATPHTA
jgi:septal ring factor EnvC (AmiA/AmiB activator)